MRLAAFRSPLPQTGPPWEWYSFSLPPQGRDRWGRLADGWWVRHHVKPRVRPFHPLHRQTPVEGSRLQNLRTVVVWCHGEKQVIQDDWRDGTSPVMPPNEPWVGYTFFQEITPEGTGATQETLTSGSSSTPQPVSLTTSSMGSGSSGPPPMPRPTEQLTVQPVPRPLPIEQPTVPESEELLTDVRYARMGTNDTISSSGASGGRQGFWGETTRSSTSRRSSAQVRGLQAMEGGLSLGYLNRLESHERRGEAEPIYEEGLDHEPGVYWSEGPQGHDGMTRDEEERDDWLYALRMEGLRQPGNCCRLKQISCLCGWGWARRCLHHEHQAERRQINVKKTPMILRAALNFSNEGRTFLLECKAEES